MLVLWVGLGGMIGAVMRYGVYQLVQIIIAPAYHFTATISVNIIGSCCIGIAYALFAAIPDQTALRLFIVTGILGGFTTFSAFTLENMVLLQRDQAGLFMVNVSVSVLLSLAACMGGYWLTRQDSAL